MKRKITSILTSVIIALTTCIGITAPAAFANEVDDNSIEICVDENLNYLDIYNLTKRSNAADWILNLTGERLINLDDQGYFSPGIADSFEIIPFPYGDEEETTEEPPTIEWPEWPQSWEYDSLPAGYSSLPPDTVINWNENDFDFLNGEGPLVVQFVLKDNVKCEQGDVFDAYDLNDFINTVKTIFSNTIYNDLWSCVGAYVDGTYYDIEVINQRTINLYFDFTFESFGFIDFLYGLTSPMGSIFCIENIEDRIHSLGAYSVNEELNLEHEYENSFYLQCNEYWYAGWVYMENISFVYKENPMEDLSSDICVFGSGYDFEENGYTEPSFTVADNPLAIIFSDTKTYGKDINVRNTVAHALNREAINANIFNNTLAGTSNDLWAIDGNFNFWQGAYSPFSESNNWTGDTISMSLLTSNNPKNTAVATALQNSLANDGINVIITTVAESLFDNYVNFNNFDMVLSDLDWSNMNSVHNILYNNSNSLINDLLYWAKHSANQSTYATLHVMVQAECVNSKAIINLGWKTKQVFMYNASGFTAPTGYSPISEVSRMDFRYVVKNS